MIILPGKPGGWGCSHISVLSPDGEDYNHGIQWKWDKIWHFNVKQNVCEPLSLTMITNLTLSTGESPDGGCQNVPANLHANPHFVSSVNQQNLIKFAYFNIFTAEGSYFIHDLFDFGVPPYLPKVVRIKQRVQNLQDQGWFDLYVLMEIDMLYGAACLQE